MEAVGQIAAERSLHGHRADFVDGTAFGLDEIYLTVGAYSDAAPWVSDYTGQRIYYRSLRGPREDFLTIRDYLWRWDTDWFWCSRPFGVQHPAIRRACAATGGRTSTGRWSPLTGVTGSETLNASRGLLLREAVIQDVEIPLERAAAFARFFAAEVGMSPVWLCPLRLRGGQSWPLYPMQAGQVYVNFGFWGPRPCPRGARTGTITAAWRRRSPRSAAARACTRRRSTRRNSSGSTTTARPTRRSSVSMTAPGGWPGCTRSASAGSK